MAFSLSGLFHSSTSDTKMVSSGARGAEQAAAGRERADVQARSLPPGKTVSGEVVAREGDEIQIRVSRDTVISARMEKDIPTSMGQRITFQVQSNASGMIALRPLFQNMAQENTALRALTQAGIEINGKSMQMVFSMMQEGMSINKNSLQEMYRQVAGASDADIPAIVQMNRLQIPVTPENLQQFTAYKNYEHQLLASFAEVADGIPGAAADIFATGGLQEGVAFIDKLLTIFGSGERAEDAAETMTETPGGGTEAAGDPAGGTAGQPGAAGAEAAGKALIMDAALQGESGIAGGGKGMALPGADAADGKTAAGDAGQTETGRDAIPVQDRENLAQMVKQAGGSPDTAAQIVNGEMGKDALYRAVQELVRQADSPERQAAVRTLFLSKGFQKVLSGKIENQWTLTAPGDVAKKEVEKLYARLNEQTRALTRALADSLKADSPLFKSVRNIRENVDFMNQLNQMYSYVQLPMKLRGEKAHGDLYVYTNKKNLAKKDGNVSAFLHLDMEHLGMVDVYVAMERGRINTNFYLADEKSLDLLEQNIDTLTKRLTEKGYQADAKLMLKEESGNVMEEIIRADKNISVISELSFDVRA